MGAAGAAALGVVGFRLRRTIIPRVEEPQYEVERTVDGLEIRGCPAAVVAETAPQLGQYNPPWIPGPFRHNEMVVTLEPEAGQPAGP